MSENENFRSTDYDKRLDALDKLAAFRALLKKWQEQQRKLGAMNYQSDLVTIQFIMLSDHINRLEDILDA